MSPNHLITASGTILLLLLLPLAAVGQIDHRVNQGNAGVAGRANDANPAVGSSGINPMAPRYDAGGYARAVITGNVTGLAGFKGDSPVVQNNWFRGNLPSADLSSFNALTVGVGDVTANRVLTPGRYYDVQQTISDLGFIRSSLNEPGSSQLISPNIIPPSTAAPLPPVGLSPVPVMTDLRVDQVSNLIKLGLIQQKQVVPGAGRLVGPTMSDWRYQSATGSSIFGVPPVPSLQELRASQESLRNLPPTTEQPNQPSEPFTDNRGFGPGLGVTTPSIGPTPVNEAPGLGIYNEPVSEQPEAALPVDRRGLAAVERPGAEKPPSTLGEDRFTDFYRAVQTAQQKGIYRLGFEAVGGAPPEPAAPGVVPVGPRIAAAEPGPAALSRRAMLRHPATDAMADLATAAKWAGQLLENPVTTFAGRYRNQLNQYLETGEEALRKGQYYRAAEMFELAQTVDPTNPLPLLDRGHALLAAGDYMSAAVCLQQGIARFPQIAAFRIDLPALGGSVYDVRRADLEKKLASSDQYELRFLLGYLELYSGLPEEGIRDLEQAAKAAPPDSIIAIFADLVTNRRELPPLPQQPGSVEPNQPR